MNFEQLANYVLTFAMVALAVYRLSVMISSEAGPWDTLARMRNALGASTMIGKLVRCPFCLSFWFGLAGTPFLPYYGVGWFIVTALALSGIATLLVKKYG